MKSENNNLFSSMPVAQAILMRAVPTVVSQIITIIYNMADTFFIGQLGDPKQVAAATLAMPLFMFMTALSNLFGVGGVAWATPVAEVTSMVVAAVMVIPYIRKLGR